MELEDTYNVHKTISCVFPHFKSRFLCKHNLHNYRVYAKVIHHPPIYEQNGYFIDVTYPCDHVSCLKCYCCGKEEELEV